MSPPHAFSSSNPTETSETKDPSSGPGFGSTEVADSALLEKRLVRKLDARMSIIVVIYILNYIDRSNASVARLQGFEQDLHLEGQQYSTVISIMFVGYIFMQVPSNMFLNWVERPSIYLPCGMIAWGTISILTGATTNFTGAFVARFFLGFVEATFFPGVLFLVSRWYKQDEIGLRTSLVTCGAILSNAWGALIASGILKGMQGKLGHAAWRWLFYIEGSLTIFIAICAMFILPDFPHNTRWLSAEERQLAVSRIEEGAHSVGTADEVSHVSPTQGFRMAIADWKVWWFAIALTAQILSGSFYLYFPTLSATMGFDTTVSLLLCAPPWVLSTLVAFLVTRHSDKHGPRFNYIAVLNLVGIIGFIIASCTMNVAARYISLFLMAQMYAGLIVFYAWMSNPFPQPPAKRAVAIALMNAFSQLGSVAGSYVWPTTWGPTYRYSYAICIAAAALSIGMCWTMSFHLTSLNRRIEKGEQGDNKVGFRYLV